MDHQPYLKNPNKYPDPDNIDTWGDESIIVDFVGGPYQFSGLSKIQVKALQTRFANCCIDFNEDNPPVVEGRVARINEDDFRVIDRSAGYVYERMDYLFQGDIVKVTGQYFTADLSLAETISATIWTPLEAHPWFPGIVFENFFRNVVSYRLLELGGALLHSSGVVNQKDRAWLFVGRSGAGKSTLSSLASSKGYPILSDDLNAILQVGDSLLVEKVPFSGTFRSGYSRGSQYPLESLYSIIKDTKNYLEPISKGNMLALLLANSPFVNQDTLRHDRLFSNLLKILEHCKHATLHFNLDGEFTDLLESD